MATKKKTTDVVEEVKEAVVEETPKTTKKTTAKKSTAKKAKAPVAEEVVVEEPKVEEPVIEEVKVEEPIIEEPKSEESVVDTAPVAEPVVEEKPKKSKQAKIKKIEEPAPTEEIAAETPKDIQESTVVADAVPYKGKVAATMIFSRKGPGLNYHTVRTLYKGAIVVVSKVVGNWGKISRDTWVNINYIEKI